jgi:hypothetical protein
MIKKDKTTAATRSADEGSAAVLVFPRASASSEQAEEEITSPGFASPPCYQAELEPLESETKGRHAVVAAHGV